MALRTSYLERDRRRSARINTATAATPATVPTAAIMMMKVVFVVALLLAVALVMVIAGAGDGSDGGRLGGFGSGVAVYTTRNATLMKLCTEMPSAVDIVAVDVLLSVITASLAASSVVVKIVASTMMLPCLTVMSTSLGCTPRPIYAASPMRKAVWSKVSIWPINLKVARTIGW